MFLSSTGLWKGWRDGLIDGCETDRRIKSSLQGKCPRHPIDQQGSHDQYPALLVPEKPAFFRFSGSCLGPVLLDTSTHVLLCQSPWRSSGCHSFVTDLLFFDRMSSEIKAVSRRRRLPSGRNDAFLLLAVIMSLFRGPLRDRGQRTPIRKHR